MAKRQHIKHTLVTDHPEAVGYTHPIHSSKEVDLVEAARAVLAPTPSNVYWEDPYEPSLYDLVDAEPLDCKIGSCDGLDCLTCRNFYGF